MTKEEFLTGAEQKSQFETILNDIVFRFGKHVFGYDWGSYSVGSYNETTVTIDHFYEDGGYDCGETFALDALFDELEWESVKITYKYNLKLKEETDKQTRREAEIRNAKRTLEKYGELK